MEFRGETRYIIVDETLIEFIERSTQISQNRTRV